MIPDRPGWWRARWKDEWSCELVDDDGSGELKVWTAYAGWRPLDAPDEWGQRIWMPGDSA